MKVTRSRSAFKAITWRITGTVDTFVISYFITHKPVLAASIAGFEIATKTILYYFHERAWNNIQWGRVNAS